jgi:hypothetical protein
MTAVTSSDTGSWQDDITHGADHLDEARIQILTAYHSGRELPDGQWRLAATLGTIADYVHQMQIALAVMSSGGLRETGNGRWLVSDGATETGPYLTLAEALTDIRAQEDEDEDGTTSMVYEDTGDPDEPGRNS